MKQVPTTMRPKRATIMSQSTFAWGWVWAIILPFGDQRRFEATGAFQLLNGFEYFSGDRGAGFAASGPALNHDEHHVAGVFIRSVGGEPCDVIDDAVFFILFF